MTKNEVAEVLKSTSKTIDGVDMVSLTEAVRYIGMIGETDIHKPEMMEDKKELTLSDVIYYKMVDNGLL